MGLGHALNQTNNFSCAPLLAAKWGSLLYVRSSSFKPQAFRPVWLVQSARGPCGLSYCIIVLDADVVSPHPPLSFPPTSSIVPATFTSAEAPPLCRTRVGRTLTPHQISRHGVDAQLPTDAPPAPTKSRSPCILALDPPTFSGRMFGACPLDG